MSQSEEKRKKEALSDADLMAQVCQADGDALTVLYDRYSGFVFTISLQIIGHKQLAEEITIDVFELVWRKAETFDKKIGNFKPWLARLTRNRSIDCLRREKVRPEYSSIAWSDWLMDNRKSSSSPEKSAARSMQQERVRKVIRDLPPEQQQALAYSFFGGYSHREISELLDLPLGTVKTRLRLAMKKLTILLIEES